MMKARQWGVCLAAWVGMCGANAALAGDAPTSAMQAPEVRLHGSVVTLPIVLVKYYPFFEGSVGGTRGKFMLDTGESAAMSINDHRVPLSDAKVLGGGNYASGESFKTHINAVIHDVRVSSLHFPDVSDMESHDATQLENHITPDFIGWLGYGAFHEYALKVDYAALKATFISGDLSAPLANEKVLARLRVPFGSRPNIPVASGNIEGTTFHVAFDTGQNGALFLDPATRLKLTGSGSLVREEDGTFTVSGLIIDGWQAPPLTHMDVMDSPAPFAKAIGVTGANLVTVGYALLKQYPTLWDFKGHTIYILAPK
jgi:hypothetical protein